MGGIETVAAAVRADLAARLPSQNKKQREGLALLVATGLDVRSVNLMELAAAVPRAAERLDMRYQWISRLLGNARIDVEAVMAPYAREVLARACAGSRALVVIIDQSKVNDAHHRVMVSLRVGERALPLAWRVKKTQGAIGFREQRDALATVAALLPEGVHPTLMGDRFYGSPALIAWCRDHGWGWRLRCKQDLRVFDNGHETTLAECFACGEHRLEDVALTGKRARTKRARTHVAMVQEDGAGRRPGRTMDHRHVRASHARACARLRPALGHRGDVLGFQDPGVQSRGQPDRAHRSARPAHPGSRAGALLGGLYRTVGRHRKQNRRRKKKPRQRSARMSPVA